MHQRTGHAAQFCHHQYITGANILHELIPAGPVHAGSGHLVGENLLAARLLQGVNLIGNFDFTASSSPVDIEALAARYQNEDFWRRSMTEGDEDGPQ